jgi:hypothetical protein
MEKLKFRIYHLPKNPQESSDFALRPTPVFGGESKQGKILYVVFNKNIHNGADVSGPGPMSLKPGQSMLLCPSAVAIHNNGDVLWQISWPGHLLSFLIP